MPGVAYNPGDFGRYGGGFVDYSDNDYTNGATVALAAGVPYQVTRDLAPTANNYRFNRPFDQWQPWDNSAKLVRARALYDIFATSSDIRVVPDKVGGVLRVSFMAGQIEMGGKNMALTALPGNEEKIRVDFIFPVRNSFFTNGARIMLTASVPMTLVEFSPEFYPLGYEA
jgi:hypothetical protein